MAAAVQVMGSMQQVFAADGMLGQCTEAYKAHCIRGNPLGTHTWHVGGSFSLLSAFHTSRAAL
jgi:hypothetical protein